MEEFQFSLIQDFRDILRYLENTSRYLEKFWRYLELFREFLKKIFRSNLGCIYLSSEPVTIQTI